jgi:mannose-6-phosphate isomerase
MIKKEKIRKVFEKGEGVLQLTPTWVPRGFNEPGKRLRLHPDDYFAFGMDRGGVCERWLGSLAKAMNGPKTGETEGMSYVLEDEKTKEQALFLDYVEELGAELIGEGLMEKYGTWPTFAKLYDYDKPLFHHLHLTEERAQRLGMHGKPEAYYFPRQYNSYLGRFPVTYFGFDPSTTKEEVMECLENYDVKDNRITELSRAFRIKLGTGWYTAAGVIHAPASVVTYEPQWNSDVNTIMENVTMGEVNGHHMLTDCTPEEEKDNLEAIFGQIDWEECTRPDYKEKYFRAPKPLEVTQEGLQEAWVAYANEWVAAKEVTVAPGAEVVLYDQACYCALVTQGHGTFGVFECEAPGMLRFGDISGDEFFVSESAAKQGIRIKNMSSYEPLVILQNFANNNEAVPKTV